MWKKHQQETKQKQKVKLAVIALALLILVIFFGKSISLLSLLNQPSGITLSYSKLASWNQKTAINILVAYFDPSLQKTNLNFITYQPKNNTAVALALTDKIFLEIPKDYGNWELGSIYKLGQEQKPPIGANLLELSVSSLLGLPVDAILITKDKALTESTDSLITRLHQNPLNIIGLLTAVKTNLSPIDTTKVLWALSQVRKDKITELNLADSSITESKLLKDSSRVLGVDSVKIDYFIRQNMADQVILDESLAIAVFNATAHPGLAQEAARMIINMGGNVVITGNLDSKLGSSKVILTAGSQVEKNNLTVSRLTEVFAPDCLRRTCTNSDSNISLSRAQVNIILGEDFYSFWHQR